jgi:hypothetical protein
LLRSSYSTQSTGGQIVWFSACSFCTGPKTLCAEHKHGAGVKDRLLPLQELFYNLARQQQSAAIELGRNDSARLSRFTEFLAQKNRLWWEGWSLGEDIWFHRLRPYGKQTQPHWPRGNQPPRTPRRTPRARPLAQTRSKKLAPEHQRHSKMCCLEEASGAACAGSGKWGGVLIIAGAY